MSYEHQRIGSFLDAVKELRLVEGVGRNAIHQIFPDGNQRLEDNLERRTGQMAREIVETYSDLNGPEGVYLEAIALEYHIPVGPEEVTEETLLTDIMEGAYGRHELLRLGIKSVGQLEQYTEEELLEIRGIGHVYLRNIVDTLAKYNRHLATEETPR